MARPPLLGHPAGIHAPPHPRGSLRLRHRRPPNTSATRGTSSTPARLSARTSTSTTDNGPVSYKGRTTRVRAYPISIDAAGLQEYAHRRKSKTTSQALRASHCTSRRSSASIAPSRARTSFADCASYELLLERYPELRRSVNFLQFLVPSRSELGVYQTYTDEIFELIESINDHFGDLEWQPVQRLLRRTTTRRPSPVCLSTMSCS